MIKSEISKKLDKLQSNDNLIVSDNSCIWRFWYKGQCRLSFIEHGASTYGLSSQSVGWKLYIKKLLTFFTNYNYIAKPNVYYLTDGGMKKFRNKDKKSNVLSLNIQVSVNMIFSKLKKTLKQKHIEAYKELSYIKEIVSKKTLIIYLPNSGMNTSNIFDYFSQQVTDSKIDTEKTFILIKKHLRDDYGHSWYVKSFFSNYYEFKHSINKYLPAEFLLYFFDNSKLFGTNSSAHLYSYWWLNKIPLFINPENDCNELFQSEYSATLTDFKQFNIATKRS